MVLVIVSGKWAMADYENGDNSNCQWHRVNPEIMQLDSWGGNSGITGIEGTLCKARTITDRNRPKRLVSSVDCI
jgi:hypothetical protein